MTPLTLPQDSPARLLFERLLTPEEFEQAVDDVVAVSAASRPYRTSVRLLAELAQERVGERAEDAAEADALFARLRAEVTD